ncbi:MAG: hypothetical protein AB2L24_12415 [Mangrovibacterium sp.]
MIASRPLGSWCHMNVDAGDIDTSTDVTHVHVSVWSSPVNRYGCRSSTCMDVARQLMWSSPVNLYGCRSSTDVDVVR